MTTPKTSKETWVTSAIDPDEQFLRDLLAAINQAASKGKWDPDATKRAHTYAVRLVKGTGDLARGLSDVVMNTVRKRFALCCVVHDIASNRYPGQSTKWYAERHEEAQKYWAERNATK